MSRPRPALPAVIEELLHAIGRGPTMALVRALGGREIRIPISPSGETWAEIAEAIGAVDAQKLVQRMGGSEIYIAYCARALKAERNRRMIERYDELLRAGRSARQAVAALVREFAPISYRQVENIVNAALPAVCETAQGELF